MPQLKFILDPFSDVISDINDNSILFDSHCHFLNLKILALELKAMVKDKNKDFKPWVILAFMERMMRYSRRKNELPTPPPPPPKTENNIIEDAFKSYFERINHQNKQMIEGAKGALNLLERLYYDSDTVMMEYIKKLEEKEDEIIKTLSYWLAEGAFDEYLSSEETLYKKMIEYYKNTKFAKRKIKIVPLTMDFRYMLDNYEDGNDESWVPKLLPPSRNDPFSPGYTAEINALENLSYENRDIYPFLAVDPRRPDIRNLVLQKVNRIKGPFYGVKLYPKLGFSPNHKDLVPILKYCAKNEIPVTAHCTPGGFPPIGTYGFEFKEPLGHPKRWIEVFDQNPELHNLYLDLAHYPSMPGEWQNELITLMNAYPNVYTDISCATDDDQFEFAKDAMIRGIINPNRVLFGTDFDVISVGTMSIGKSHGMHLDTFLNRYLSVFEDVPEIRRMLEIDNPQNFFRFVDKW
jgi:hypothetical protein